MARYTPVFDVFAQYAEYYSITVGHNQNQANAFANAYLSAMITYNLGSFSAYALGNVLEDATTTITGAELPSFSNDPRDTFRDLNNDMWGRAIGNYAIQQNLSHDEIVARVQAEVIRGPESLLIVDPNSDGRVPPKFSGYAFEFDVNYNNTYNDEPGSFFSPNVSGTPT